MLFSPTSDVRKLLGYLIPVCQLQLKVTGNNSSNIYIYIYIYIYVGVCISLCAGYFTSDELSIGARRKTAIEI